MTTTSDFPSRYDLESDSPARTSVPLTAVVLARDEEPNIQRCVRSLAWAEHVLVIDSGSVDDTVALAAAAGAEVVETTWRGFGPQREWSLRLPQVRHDWVLFVDADEWISTELATEIASMLSSPGHSAYSMMFRLVFQGRWIAHCGWYPSTRVVRLLNRDSCRFPVTGFGEHPIVEGSTGHLHHDLIDDDLKPLSAWLHKHVNYAPLEARRQLDRASMQVGGSAVQQFIKKEIATRVPARPLVQFFYMYMLRAGFLDGRQGLLFCILHGWFQIVVAEEKRAIRSASPL